MKMKNIHRLTLILGGAASGKSEYAEQLAQKEEGGRIYLATMQSSESARARIEKHIRRREGMGMRTVEDPFLTRIPALSDLLPAEAEGSRLRPAVILLEDLPNLLANRRFSAEGDYAAEFGDVTVPSAIRGSEDETIPSVILREQSDRRIPPPPSDTPEEPELQMSPGILRLYEDLRNLQAHTGHLIIVSGDLFRDGTVYDEMTERYLQDLGNLHRLLAAAADRVVEVVCGIPVERIDRSGIQ